MSNPMQSPKIVSSRAFTVLGMAIDTTPGSPEIGALWQTLMTQPKRDFPRAEPGVAYGVMQLDRSSGVLRYMAGEAVGNEVAAPPAMQLWNVPACDYAVFPANLENVSQVFNNAYANWLPSSGLTRGDAPDLERYGQDFGDENTDFEIWIPVLKS
jgi:predicted transcriptional regulator YdeE